MTPGPREDLHPLAIVIGSGHLTHLKPMRISLVIFVTAREDKVAKELPGVILAQGGKNLTENPWTQPCLKLKYKPIHFLSLLKLGDRCL